MGFIISSGLPLLLNMLQGGKHVNVVSATQAWRDIFEADVFSRSFLRFLRKSSKL